MNELALFAGAGGGILGGKLLGWTTVCAVEINDYARRVLMSRQDDGCLAPFPIWDDITTFDGKPWRGVVDVISGGFPCQDISAAGKGAGIDGNRSGLWREMARIIREVEPRYVFVENSPMLTSRGLGRVLGDLAAMGYDAAWGVLGAHHVGAPHKRDRIWIVAHAEVPDDSPSESKGRRLRWPQVESGGGRSDSPMANPDSQRCGEAGQLQPAPVTGVGGKRQVVADAQTRRRQKLRTQPKEAGDLSEPGVSLPNPSSPRSLQRMAREARRSEGVAGVIDHDSSEAGGSPGRPKVGWWATEPDVGRVAHELARWLDLTSTPGLA